MDEAVKLQTELYESICDHVGTTKPRALSAAAQLAGLLSSQGKLAASEQLAMRSQLVVTFLRPRCLMIQWDCAQPWLTFWG